LPQLVKDRLIKRDLLDIGVKKSNEYRVREYIKDYLKDLEEIIWVLDTLPDKQFKKVFKDEDVYRLLEIAERALVNLDFMPIRRNDDGKLIAIKGLVVDSAEGGLPRAFSIEREATDVDKNRYSTLQKHIARLEKFVKPLLGAIYNDLDQSYLKDLIKTAKKEGYVPTMLDEQNRYLPRLTPGQQRFERTRGVLFGFGIRGIKYPGDLETFKEAMRSAEGKALIKKFESMRDEQTSPV